jgi:hypothetical protein
MKTTELTDLLKGTLTAQIAAYIASENPFPIGIINWLAELILLENIPFNNLIADEKLLPNESMRLFYLDKNWTNALLDGALSIGIHSERDMLLQKAMNQIIRQQTNEEISDKNKVIGTISGLMIRSSIVTNYKDFEVLGFENTVKKNKIKILRRVQLSSDILMVLFETIPQVIEIKTTIKNQILAIVNNNIPLRAIENEVGKPLNQTVQLNDSEFRDSKKRVLNITALQQKIAQQLGKKNLSPSELAIQLTQSPTIFQLVNEAIEIPESRNTSNETTLDKQLIFSRLFQ